MRLHGVACAMRDFNRSLRPDATNPEIIVVPDRQRPLSRIEAYMKSSKRAYRHRQSLPDGFVRQLSSWPPSQDVTQISWERCRDSSMRQSESCKSGEEVLGVR
jgi:hypothetical protein